MKIEFWQNQSGRSPVIEFIKKEPNAAAARIMKTVDHLAQRGTLLLGSGKMKPLTGYRLYELIINFKGVFYRIILA